MSLKDKTRWKIVTTPKEGCGIMSRGVYYPKDMMAWIRQHIHHLESDNFKPIRIYYDDHLLAIYEKGASYEAIKHSVKEIVKNELNREVLKSKIKNEIFEGINLNFINHDKQNIRTGKSYKIFISVPMKWKTNEEVNSYIEIMKNIWNEMHKDDGNKYVFLHNFHNYKVSKNVKHESMFYLSRAIEKLSRCDGFIGIETGSIYTGCDIEANIFLKKRNSNNIEYDLEKSFLRVPLTRLFLRS